MSIEPRPDDAGLFLVLPIPGKSDITNQLYARVTSITVYSAPQPSRKRVVAYQVTFWENSPVEDLEGSEGHLWVGGTNNDEVTFYFPVENQAWSMASLENGCAQHFLTYVVPERLPVRLQNPVTQIYNVQTGGKCWDVYVREEPEPLTTITLLKHEEKYTSETNRPLMPQPPVAYYRLNDDAIQTLEVEFSTTKAWEDVVAEKVSEPNTFVRRWAKYRIVN